MNQIKKVGIEGLMTANHLYRIFSRVEQQLSSLMSDNNYKSFDLLRLFKCFIESCYLMGKDKLIKLIEKSVQDFYQFDQHLIKLDANERSITAKLACYMSNSTLLQDYHVDCEYNKNIDKSKRTQSANLIFPDIIIHKRGNNENNILALEVKKVRKENLTANLNDINSDFHKLGTYDFSYNYKYIGVLLLTKEYNKSVCLHKESNIHDYLMTAADLNTIKHPTFIYSITSENKQ